MNTRQIFNTVWTFRSDIAMAIFAAVFVAMAFAVVRYRGGRQGKPSEEREHRAFEGAYVVGIATLAGVLIYGAIVTNGRELRNPRPATTVDVTAFRWCWAFGYPSAHFTVTADCVNGRIPTLTVPAGEPVAFHLTSRDVLHEMWIPEARFKREAFPHYVSHFTITFPTTGTFAGRCSAYCGIYHYAMQFAVHVVTPAAYHRFLATTAPTAGVGT